ncbi:unnamed protein product [Ilex paraguariensis]|uniref:Uncharacterized protein n=1 Tax=Ilex paraguariensis TaxID=185542 RepID=A0ABC8QN14_9AQUA
MATIQRRFQVIERGLGNLDSVIDVGARRGLAAGDDEVVVILADGTVAGEDVPLNADGIRAGVDELVRLVAVERRGAVDGGLAAIGLVGGGNASPENDAVRPRVPRGNAMGEGQLGRPKFDAVALPGAALDQVDVDAQVCVPGRGAEVVDVAVEAGSDGIGQQAGEKEEHGRAHAAWRMRTCQARRACSPARQGEPFLRAVEWLVAASSDIDVGAAFLLGNLLHCPCSMLAFAGQSMAPRAPDRGSAGFGLASWCRRGHLARRVVVRGGYRAGVKMARSPRETDAEALSLAFERVLCVRIGSYLFEELKRRRKQRRLA